MNKLWVVARREYGIRVRRKSFIITTLAVPVVMALIPIVGYLLGAGPNEERIAVIDQSGYCQGPWTPSPGVAYTLVNRNADDVIRSIAAGKSEWTGVLHIPTIDLTDTEGITLHTKEIPGLRLRLAVQTELTRLLTAQRLSILGVDASQISAAQKAPDLATRMIGGTEGSSEQKVLAYVAAFVIGLIMYIALIIYGVLVMNGVVEEKSNRIVEVIVSAVRPFDMMLGKIVGVAAVGLTQFAIWITLGLVMFQIAVTWVGLPSDLASVDGMTDPDMALMSTFLANVASVDFTLLAGGFAVYFIGGYFFYASLFAAAASAANDASDLNSLSFPITFPLIISFFVLNAAIQNPQGAVAFWFSMIPFTSPVVMIGRIPFGVPAWQLVLSIVLLIAGFLAAAWTAARIYRVGMLLYGKKYSFLELLRWIRYSG